MLLYQCFTCRLWVMGDSDNWLTSPSHAHEPWGSMWGLIFCNSCIVLINTESIWNITGQIDLEIIFPSLSFFFPQYSRSKEVVEVFRSAYSVRQQLISLMEKMSTTTEPCTNEQFDSSDVEEESRFAPSQAQIPGKEWLHCSLCSEAKVAQILLQYSWSFNFFVKI